MAAEVSTRYGLDILRFHKLTRGQLPRAPLATLLNAVNAQLVQAPALPSEKKATKKRKSTEDHAPVPAVNLDDINVEGMPMDQNCDQVRRKINRLLDLGAITKTAFAREIGVSAKSLSGFLGAHGAFEGSGFAAYGAAWEYFKKREIAGVGLPAKKQKTSDATGTAAKESAAAPVDLSDIVLPGEELDAVPVYDTCDEIRKKINAYLKRPGVTQAQFCRDIYAQLKGPCRPGRPFQSGQLARFRGMKGPNAGAKSAVFYGAYVFFEKLRIKENKPKSKHRLVMEQQWGPHGFDREHDHRTG